MTIRTGIGGWTYPEWRGGTFFPKGLRQADEQAFATRTVAAIEVNATYYRLQRPGSFANWRAAAPPGFVYSLKGSRFVTNRKVLATAGEAVERFMQQGVTELGIRYHGAGCWGGGGVCGHAGADYDRGSHCRLRLPAPPGNEQ